MHLTPTLPPYLKLVLGQTNQSKFLSANIFATAAALWVSHSHADTATLKCPHLASFVRLKIHFPRLGVGVHLKRGAVPSCSRESEKTAQALLFFFPSCCCWRCVYVRRVHREAFLQSEPHLTSHTKVQLMLCNFDCVRYSWASGASGRGIAF